MSYLITHMIWIVFAVLTAVTVLLITRPFGANGQLAADGDADLAAQKSQLAEIERETGRGLLSAEEAERTRVEVARRLLRMSRKASDPETYAALSKRSATVAFLSTAAVVVGFALALYSRYGGNGLADQPLEARLRAPVEQQPLDIQIANVERRLRTNPDDAVGWQAIAPVYFRLGQYDKAIDAYRKLIALTGESEDKLLSLGESLAFSNNGTINDAAKAVFARALNRNPKSLRARFWTALSDEQDGKTAEATKVYLAIRDEGAPEAWRKAAEERLAALGVPAVGVTAKPNREVDVLAGEQGEMIRGMVANLAAKLKDNPNDVEGWLKLIRSYVVLKQPEKAREAAVTARGQFKDDDKALAQINGLAAGLRIETAAARPSPGADILAGEQGEMIRGMVASLAAKLKDNPNDVEGWLKLMRSYVVLQQPEKAREAAVAARGQFKDDEKALGQINGLAAGLRIDTSASDGKS